MSKQLIVDQEEFEELCTLIRLEGVVAFDTEFVSEDSYQPELCLLQFKTPSHCAAVDPRRVHHLNPWWEIMADEDTTIIVHGGQAEIRFCLVHSGHIPRKLVDIQMAEGLRSRSYPLGYTTLVQRVLGVRLSGGAARTDWRKRPLTEEQINYALADVEHALPIWAKQEKELTKLGRLEWAHTEFQAMVTDIAEEVALPGWERINGIQKLSSTELAVAVELYNWREEEARRRDCLPRRILRDDLLLEIARRQPTNEKQLMATRDMNRSGYKKRVPEMLEAVARGLSLPKQKRPQINRKTLVENPNDQVLGKLLSIALANRCAEMNLSLQLVGTAADLKDLVRHHVYRENIALPRLTLGWRAEVCGNILTDLLDGKILLRVGDPLADAPLVFEHTHV